ncbi:MAG: hypothetical protein AAB797_02695 [Patescibacteria group bacterium]
MSRNAKTINILIFGIIIVAAIIIIFWITAGTTATKPESDGVVSRRGLHLHPKLDIYIKGQLQEIPADVGIGAIHKPIHTHDRDNIIHLEFSGLVTLDNTRLQEFFKIWGKQFNSNCIFDNCNGPSGTVKMLVNGQPNDEFEKYPMKNKDKIEIRYE